MDEEEEKEEARKEECMNLPSKKTEMALLLPFPLEEFHPVFFTGGHLLVVFFSLSSRVRRGGRALSY